MKDKVKALVTQRAAKVKELEGLNAKALEEDRDLTDVETTAYGEIKTEIEQIDRSIARYKEVEQLRAATAQPLDDVEDKGGNGGEQGDGSPSTAVVEPSAGFAQTMKQMSMFFGTVYHKAPKKTSSSDFGCFVVSLLHSKGMPAFAAHHAWSKFGNEAVAKALATTPAQDGGVLVPTEFSKEFIELLRPASVIRAAQPRIMNFPGGFGSIQLPAAATGVTAGWVGENQPIGYGQMTFAPITLTPKKLAAITAISNELIRRSSPDVDTIVRDDLVQSVATVESATMLTSAAATATQPIGLWGIALAAGQTNAQSALPTTLANVTTDLDAGVLTLKGLNTRMTRPAWFMSPRSEMYLMGLRDGNGNFAFRQEMLTGRLLRWPIFVTTSIADNLGSNTNESRIFLADMDDMILAQELAVTIDVSSEASYTTTGAAANLVSAFQYDQTVVRVIETVDFAARRPSVSVLTDVTWS